MKISSFLFKTHEERTNRQIFYSTSTLRQKKTNLFLHFLFVLKIDFLIIFLHFGITKMNVLFCVSATVFYFKVGWHFEGIRPVLFTQQNTPKFKSKFQFKFLPILVNNNAMNNWFQFLRNKCTWNGKFEGLSLQKKVTKIMCSFFQNFFFWTFSKYKYK